jgi:hypothetical protein
MVAQAYPFVARKVLRNDSTNTGELLRDMLYDSEGNIRPSRLGAMLQAALGYVADESDGFVDFDAVPEQGASVQEVRVSRWTCNSSCLLGNSSLALRVGNLWYGPQLWWQSDKLQEAVGICCDDDCNGCSNKQQLVQRMLASLSATCYTSHVLAVTAPSPFLAPAAAAAGAGVCPVT